MFFASIGREGGEEVDVFSFVLAEKLGRTLGELEDMPHAEYTAWKSFHKVRNQQEELKRGKA